MNFITGWLFQPRVSLVESLRYFNGVLRTVGVSHKFM